MEVFKPNVWGFKVAAKRRRLCGRLRSVGGAGHTATAAKDVELDKGARNRLSQIRQGEQDRMNAVQKRSASDLVNANIPSGLGADAWFYRTEGMMSANTSQYTGRENDGTGLYYYRARYYSPSLKRFISEDPIGLAGGMNTYAYVGGNSVSRSDPTGLAWFGTNGEAPTVGRDSMIGFEPGIGPITNWIEQNIPAAHTFGKIHDATVDAGTYLGIPDALVNVPTMPGAYLTAVGVEINRSVAEAYTGVKDWIKEVIKDKNANGMCRR